MRYGWFGALVLVGAVACGSESGTEDTASGSGASTWEATEQARTHLKIERWELRGEAQDADLWGLASAADGTAIERLHAHFARKASGAFTVDVDVPTAWRLEFVPGQLPIVSGEIPDDVAMALATSALDAPAEGGGATGVRVVTNLSPRGNQDTGQGEGGSLVAREPTCLVTPSVMPLVGSAEYRDLVGRAFAVLQQFASCRLADGSVPDPTNPAEQAQAQRCVDEVNRAGCNASEAYNLLLGGVASGAADRTATPSASDVGLCTYKGPQMRCMMPPATIRECMSADACASKGGTFSADASCSGPPVSTGGCGH